MFGSVLKNFLSFFLMLIIVLCLSFWWGVKKFEKPKGFLANKLSSTVESQLDIIENFIEEKALWQRFGL